MSLAGKGAVAIWHDIAPEGREDYYNWHGQEHMPERVGIPGFLRGRRYVALRASLEFFNLYEAQTPDVVAGPDYQARLNNPTPWTASVMKYFKNVARSVCRVAATSGHGQGGLIATWRYDVPDARADEHGAKLAALLDDLVKRNGVAGAHLLRADERASATETAEQRARGTKNVIPRWIILLEGWGDEAPFDKLCRDAVSDRVLSHLGASGPADFGLYRLQNSRAKTDTSAG